MMPITIHYAAKYPVSSSFLIAQLILLSVYLLPLILLTPGLMLLRSFV